MKKSVRLPGGSFMNRFVSLVSPQILDPAQETEMVSVSVPFEGVFTPGKSCGPDRTGRV